MRYDNISFEGQYWIRELRFEAPESRFPDIDPAKMSAEERDTLSAYLRTDCGGSLTEEGLKFSSSVADELDALVDEEEEVEVDRG